jgi:structural maintenance of chromosome 2
VGVRSVTLDGDVYDPSGTLSGGSAPSGSGILVRVQELMELGEKLTVAGRKLEALEREETQGKRARDNWRQLVRELEMKEHEMKLMEQQVESSNAARVSPYPLPSFRSLIPLSDRNPGGGAEANYCGFEARRAGCAR